MASPGGTFWFRKRKSEGVNCHRKLPSFPSCHYTVFIAGIQINFVKPKRSQIVYNNLLRRAFASGKVRAAANDNRRWKSVISADQWEAHTHAVFDVGWE